MLFFGATTRRETSLIQADPHRWVFLLGVFVINLKIETPHVAFLDPLTKTGAHGPLSYMAEF